MGSREQNERVAAYARQRLADGQRTPFVVFDLAAAARAYTDFRKALRNKPDVPTTAKARGKLYEAFTEYFQRDFGKAETFLKEYEEMCKVELGDSAGAERTARMAEERRRRAVVRRDRHPRSRSPGA